ncbi:TetR/AcrR family transcriptional regulator [Nocardioides sp. NBC_00368]|uniref:TetR/AcrR family transcriptional regulator n=1 Tax=Nocardioides sp. NBC_00368 TaxID=2976000 RepID=UPI002E247813
MSGRPRLVPYAGSAPPRDQILDAAAKLFVERGFAATSTREIADAVGIRQASLYYHFAGKDDILAELLDRSVRPTVDKIAKIEAMVPPETYETALYLLALVDVTTLATAPRNIGLLSRLPDVTDSPVFAEFRNDRCELAEAYGRIGTRIARAPVIDLLGSKKLGEILVQVVDSTINLRSNGDRIDLHDADGLATTCLRICGTSDKQILAASAAAAPLFETLHAEPGFP